MKRFFLFVAFVLIFIALGLSDNSLLHLSNRYPDMNVVFYTKHKTSLDSINDGIYNQISCKARDAKKIKSMLKDISGMSISFQGGLDDINYILDYFDVKVILQKTNNDILYIYGYSKLILTPSVLVDNNYINIQLALNNQIVTAGLPIILGSY